MYFQLLIFRYGISSLSNWKNIPLASRRFFSELFPHQISQENFLKHLFLGLQGLSQCCGDRLWSHYNTSKKAPHAHAMDRTTLCSTTNGNFAMVHSEKFKMNRNGNSILSKNICDLLLEIHFLFSFTINAVVNFIMIG